jgi:hypothetical protein
MTTVDPAHMPRHDARFGSKSRHLQCINPCPLYPQERTFAKKEKPPRGALSI